MTKTQQFVILIFALCCLVANTACADRLILIPTGSTLGTAGLKGEYAANSDTDGKIYWVNLGVSKLELEGARFTDFGNTEDTDVISAQIAVLPETSFTPAVALGVRDISDETKHLGLPYEGRSLYLAVSKSVPLTGGVPVLFQDMRVHGGIGTEGLGGFFFGVEGTLPIGIHVIGEYDTEDFNWAAIYRIAGPLQAKVSSVKGDMYYGALFSIGF